MRPLLLLLALVSPLATCGALHDRIALLFVPLVLVAGFPPSVDKSGITEHTFHAEEDSGPRKIPNIGSCLRGYNIAKGNPKAYREADRSRVYAGDLPDEL